MKRLFYLLVIIALPTIIVFQYMQYRRYNPPSAYQYEVSEEIDLQYHDPEVVKKYFLLAEESASYARHCWKTHGIDVRMDSPVDPDEKQYIQNYQQILASAKHLEMKLKQSANLKKEGKTNLEIRQQEVGMRVYPFSADELKENKVVTKIGDQNGTVFQVQQLLAEKGYKLPIDGIFKEETERSVMAFQQSKNLLPNGEVDLLTLQFLFQ